MNTLSEGELQVLYFIAQRPRLESYGQEINNYLGGLSRSSIYTYLQSLTGKDYLRRERRRTTDGPPQEIHILTLHGIEMLRAELKAVMDAMDIAVNNLSVYEREIEEKERTNQDRRARRISGGDCA